MKGERVWAVYFSKEDWAAAEDPTALYGIVLTDSLPLEINMRNIPTAQQSYHGNNWIVLLGKVKGVFRQREKVKIYISGGNAWSERSMLLTMQDGIPFIPVWGRCLLEAGCILCLMTGKGCYMMKHKIWEWKMILRL